eukprot:GILK01002189.1.p1 GENE.GILK01002189.1~~GILK01002189.1.p1  ORF type:complete len:215 (-),score=19.56 GILK01002189.1:195-797(-)
MAGLLDYSLDDLIKKRNDDKPRRGGREGGRGGSGPVRRERTRQRDAPYARDSMAVDTNGTWKHDRFEGATEQRGSGGRRPFRPRAEGSRILISNLDYNVLDKDIKELFGSVGEMSKSTVHWDHMGRSKGTAEVTYATSADAERAVRDFNGRELDGKAMKVEITEEGGYQRNREGGRGGRGGKRWTRGGRPSAAGVTITYE